MNDLISEPKKLFTVEQANRTLPLVRMIARDLSSKSREVKERRQRLSRLSAGRNKSHSTSDEFYNDELEQIVSQLERDELALETLKSELLSLGALPDPVRDDVVHFPSVMRGDVVHLCWKIGEPELAFWTKVGGRYDERQPLPDSISLPGRDPEGN